mgnify:CR=1 FL=1
MRRILLASFLLTAVLTVGSATMAGAQAYGGGAVQGNGADQGTGAGAVSGTGATTGLARTGAAFVSPGLVGTAFALIIAGGIMLVIVNRRRITT